MYSVLYNGQTAEVATEKNDDDANAHPPLVSSGFTAINHPQTQLLTPESSAVATVRPGQTSSRAIGNPRRRHNPDVARYLGLGSTTEPAHLERYAPRPKRAGGQTTHRSTASVTQCLTHHVRDTDDSNTSMPIADDPMSPKSHFAHPERQMTPWSIFASESAPRNARDAVDAPRAGSFHLPLHEIGDDAGLGTCPDANGGLLCRDSSDTTTDGDDYDFDIADDELLVLTSGPCFDVPRNIPNSPAESHGGDHGSMHATDDYHDQATEEVLTLDTSQHTHRKFVSPVTPATRLLATDHGGAAQARQPIVRSPFPKPVRDRSPIIGLSSNVVLRTCFRIGEAINQSHKASRSGQQMMVELYARVLVSERTETQQYFTFCDLFHAKPPYIKGAYDAAIWKAVQLFEYDGRRLLQPGRMCRCIGMMKHNGRERVMTIHNIWEATWDDIEWVEGIVCS